MQRIDSRWKPVQAALAAAAEATVGDTAKAIPTNMQNTRDAARSYTTSVVQFGLTAGAAAVLLPAGLVATCFSATVFGVVETVAMVYAILEALYHAVVNGLRGRTLIEGLVALAVAGIAAYLVMQYKVVQLPMRLGWFVWRKASSFGLPWSRRTAIVVA
jgi:hypothetical protein